MSYDYFYGQSGELFSYFRIPKALFQDCRFRQLSTDARTLYGILLDRMSLSAKNGWLDEQGRVYIIYTVREVQESLCCAEHKAVKLFRELEDIDLIERKRRGLGRPSLIYVKDFSSGLPKAQVQNCPNSNSGAAESAILEQPKPQANKTDKNKTEWNDPDPICSGGIREQLEDYFYQVLEVDLLLRLCPDDEDTIYQIVDLLVDLHHEIVCPDCLAGDKSSASAVPVQGIPRQAERPHPVAAKPGRVQRGDQQDRHPWLRAVCQKVRHRLRYPQGHLRSAAPVSGLFQSPGRRSLPIGVQGVFGIPAEQR